MEWLKNNKAFIFVIILLLGSFGLLGSIAIDKYRSEKVATLLQEQLMEANLEIGRAKTQFGDAEKYVNELEESLQSEIKARNAEITRYGKLEARYRTAITELTGKTITTYLTGEEIKVPGDCATFTRGLLYQAITDKTLIALGVFGAAFTDHRINMECMVHPYPNRNRDIPIAAKYQLDLKVIGQIVETITPEGAVNHYINLWEIDEKGDRTGKFNLKSYNVIVKDERANSFELWAPRLDIAVGLSIASGLQFLPSASIGVSTSGYGISNTNLTWRFLRLSMDISEAPGIGFTPVLYNIGKLLPLVSNMWLGPHVSYNLEGQWGLGLILGAVL